MKDTTKTIEIGGRKLTLSKGKLAAQADSAVLATYGETVVLATVVSSKPVEDRGYFPLFVEYQERLYAGGRIKGSRWVKREGQPSEDAILTGRLIDRSIRPLFPKDYKNEVQVVVTVLSVDLENDPSVIAPIAVSAAISASSIPWYGPVGVVKVGLKDGKPFVNPLVSENSDSPLDLVVSATREAIVMIEAGASEVSEEQILEGIEFAQKEALKIVDFIEDFSSEFSITKEKVEKPQKDSALAKKVRDLVGGRIPDLIREFAVKEGGDTMVYEEIKNALSEEFADNPVEALASFDELMKANIREMILSGKRPDGRALTEIRKLSSEVSVLPRTHGSAIFKRGQTQVLTVATLAPPSLGQLIESAEGEEEKRYMHHYSMPPYATGEVGRIGSPNRREIGHGALAERALYSVIPSETDFPYAIRVVSEVMSSNGSTSMASVCGSTLSLMDAGVPLSAPVSGIAMGIVIENEKKFSILSDIAGIEDFNGDMDFKVAGTENGVTAIQLDVKTLNLSFSLLKTALSQAKEGRMFILKSMLKTLPKSKSSVSVYAPKIKSFKIDVEKIGEVIGPGGKTIKKIIAETGAQVEVEDDGTVNVSAPGEAEVSAAVSRIEGLVKEVAPGEIYEGEVRRLQPFGAFVEILPGKDGLVHVSDMSQEYVNNPEEVVAVGERVKVRVKEIDDLGRINLSMILDPSQEREKRENNRPPRQKQHRDERPRSGRGRSTGPHFPPSRLVMTEREGKFRR